MNQSAQSASWWFCARALARVCLLAAKYPYINNNGFSTNVGKNHQNQESTLLSPLLILITNHLLPIAFKFYSLRSVQLCDPWIASCAQPCQKPSLHHRALRFSGSLIVKTSHQSTFLSDYNNRVNFLKG